MLNLLINHVVLRATVYELRRVMRISRESPRWKIGDHVDNRAALDWKRFMSSLEHVI